ncbi:hypothetical protein ON010_g2509 [Phytophthora cinnamomi]|nr:hypothetical protein ON010_g2509 [Phytophthora cinnamomi]
MDTTEAQELEDMCDAVDTPFKAIVPVDEVEQDNEILGPQLLVRARSARSSTRQTYQVMISTIPSLRQNDRHWLDP